MKTASLFNDFLTAIADRGLSVLRRNGDGHIEKDARTVIDLCHMAMSSQGEASCIALSHEILTLYEQLSEGEKTTFFAAILSEFSVDQKETFSAAQAYIKDPTHSNLNTLTRASVPSRQELLRRLNHAPNAMIRLVNMRADILSRVNEDPDLLAVDYDFTSAFASWFNRGFLELRRIDWHAPAAILEKIIGYEAVHGMANWGDLRARIAPPDRCIYGFFHQSLGDEPLIFVEVALMAEIPSAIDTILSKTRKILATDQATTAVFYSISNCQKGLRGIPLGNFLIKQVVEDLRLRFPNIKDFVTLSPIPGLWGWMTDKGEQKKAEFTPEIHEAIDDVEKGSMTMHPRRLEEAALAVAAKFLCEVKATDGKPLDPVARFHLGNGARLHRLNWTVRRQTKGSPKSFSMMANYFYDLNEIEINHEKFENSQQVIVSASVEKQRKKFENWTTGKKRSVQLELVKQSKAPNP